MTLHVLADLLAGLHIPGGCPHCHATRVLVQGRWVTRHEDTCRDPWRTP